MFCGLVGDLFSVAGFAVAPLLRIGVEGLGHLRIHVLHPVVFAKLLERLTRQHQLDEQVGIADGEIEFDEGGENFKKGDLVNITMIL